ncbi:MAG: hypothetical protein CMO34_03250 [Verrucomicrobia bacterium]|nr:hypothetical protein [Verrucomicrobiota bacterium]|tara:strand:- start:41 stop:490 length:450 start_codon:yes stop_codon:yes gene_type:complete
MKKLTATLGIFLMFIASTFAQESASAIETAGAEMTFESDVIDYGTIPQFADGVRVFKFTNTGKAPLIISGAKGSCGCTVPTWPKKPINPGESAEIKVKYATDRLGPINKSVTVTSNSSEPTKVLRIKGNVIKKETTPVKKASEMTPTAG